MNDHFLILKNHRQVGGRPEAQCHQEEGHLPGHAKRIVKARPLAVKQSGEGKWSKKEQTAYIGFLIRHYETMIRGELRKSKKIFIRMSKGVRTRVPEQCRSHHQKMMQLHGTLQQIIRFFQQEVLPLHGEQLKNEKTAKTEVKTEHPPFDGLYRMEVSGGLIRIEINSDLIASY